MTKQQSFSIGYPIGRVDSPFYARQAEVAYYDNSQPGIDSVSHSIVVFYKYYYTMTIVIVIVAGQSIVNSIVTVAL